MRTTEWAMQGKDVPEHLRGQIIKFRVPENYAEAESLCENGAEDVVAKFADGNVIRLQGKLRTASGKRDKDGNLVYDLAALQKLADDDKYSVRREGVPRSIKPQTAQQRAEVAAGNALFARMESNAKFRAQMFEVLKNEDAFKAWQEAKAKATNGATSTDTAATA
jgi:hypothetical protein